MMTPAERFETPVRGPAYRTSAKAGAVGAVIMLIAYALRASDQLMQLPSSMLLMMATAFLGVVVTTWFIITGTTTIDAQGVHQHWITEKRYRWTEIQWTKHVRLPFTSRLMISTGSRPLKVIQSGTPELDEAFKEIVAYYRAINRGQIG